MLRATLHDGLLFLYLYPCFLVVGNIKCLELRNCCPTPEDGQLRTGTLSLRILYGLSNLDFSQRTQRKVDTSYSFKSIYQKFSPMTPPPFSTGLHWTLSNVLDKSHIQIQNTHKKTNNRSPKTKSKPPKHSAPNK